VTRGLNSRTKIIEALEQRKTRTSEISEKSGLSRACVSYHLKLLLKQKTVHASHSGREGLWALTKYGQERLFS
jgi:predicted transcriptional regulator